MKYRRNEYEILNQMLDDAIAGTFEENCFDESELSKLQTKLMRYLTSASMSEKKICEEKNNIKELITNISHQTKTPLTNILMYAELLTEAAETEMEKEYAGEIYAQGKKLESLIAEFRLQKVRKNKGNQLSGGERRRTEIARCLAIDPKFIMLDEPFAGVDPIAVEDIQQIVWKLKDKNIGILITDHNVQETLSITDRAYLLFEGKILFQGTPEELAENKIVREKYLSNSFVLRRKDFQLEKD